MENERWFEEIDVHVLPAECLFCTAGKNPTPEKIVRYCQQANGKKGCKNLAPKSMAEAKPGEFVLA